MEDLKFKIIEKFNKENIISLNEGIDFLEMLSELNITKKKWILECNKLCKEYILEKSSMTNFDMYSDGKHRKTICYSITDYGKKQYLEKKKRIDRENR